MAEKYELAEKDYMAGMKYKDIAAKYDVSLNTVKSWKQRKWSNKDEDATKKGVHTKQKRVHTKKELLEPVVESDELTEKQRLFCIYYIKYFNATKAYQKAYECAYTTAMTNGHGLLRNTKISKEIGRMKAEQTTELKLDVKDIIQKYIDIAFADITDFATFGKKEVEVIGMFGPVKDEDGNILMEERNYVDFKESSEIDGTIVTEVKQGKDGISVKLADKMKALEMLSRYTDLLNDNQLKQLKIEKAKAEVKQLTNETESSSRTIIVNDKEEMRRLMNERASR